MILNVRGGSGSGKSYPEFELDKEFGPGEVIYDVDQKYFQPRKKPKKIAHVLPGGLCIAGRVEMGASSRRKGEKGYSAGLDGYYPMDELNRLVQDLADTYEHVIFESLMISGTFQRWLDFAHLNEEKGRSVVFATLDTPIDLQIERVLSRNGGKPVDEEAMVKHRRQVHRCAKKFSDAGAHSFMIDHTRSYEQIRGMFIGAGWDPRVESTREVQTGPPSA